MQRLDEIIEYYLKTETNYALMITGDWGVGKTFYYKNVLNKKIQSIPTFKDNSKKYKPILISLFGLKSVEEIQAEIFLSIFPILKSKSVKLGVGIGKSLIKGILSLKNLGEYFDYVSDIDVDTKDWIKFDDLVICFDDLERISDNLQIEELVGYINSLVENENVKIIIIANENRIDRPRYKILKEKVIGNSIEFIPDLNKTYDSLIYAKFDSYSTYLSYLDENKRFILDILSKSTTNLRILSFALTYFQTIYSEILIGLPSQEVLHNKQSEILLQILKFSLIISIEYKEGHISYTNREDLDLHEGLDLINFSLQGLLPDINQNNKGTEIEKTYKDKLIKKYYSGETYQYFKSVFDFITGGTILNHEDIIKELKSYYHVEEGRILPQYEIFNHLRRPFDSSLTEKEYKTMTREMLRYTDQGSFELSFYLSIFTFAARFGNPLKFNIDKLEKRILSGMKRGMNNYKYNSHLYHSLGIDRGEDHMEHLKRIVIAVNELNDRIGIKEQKSDLERLAKKCYEDFDTFSKEVLNNKNSYYAIPIFQNFNVHKFYLFFFKSNPKIKWQIVELISMRYDQFHSDRLNLDKYFLENLKIKIEKKALKISSSGISWYLFNEFISVLNSSIAKIN